jgi:hypothetical protein
MVFCNLIGQLEPVSCFMLSSMRDIKRLSLPSSVYDEAVTRSGGQEILWVLCSPDNHYLFTRAQH